MKSEGTTTSSRVEDVKQNVHSAATNVWVTRLARLGYATKGVVYLIIGALAIQLAVGHGGKATDQRGALQTIYAEPFGKTLLIIAGIGLAGYALWRIIEAVLDTERRGTDAKSIATRVAYGFVGISYALLAFGAFSLVTNTGGVGQSTTSSTQTWTAKLLSFPFGVVLVVLVGVVVIGIAGYLIYHGMAAKFRKEMALESLSARARNAVVMMGRIGYSALGVVFGVIGVFLIVAALQNDPRQARGLDGALKALLQQPFGPYILLVVALGLFTYGVYSFLQARYRRLDGKGWQ